MAREKMEEKIKELLRKSFEEIDKIGKKTDEISRSIREKVNIFKNPEESRDPEVIENLKKRDELLDQYNYVRNICRGLAEILNDVTGEIPKAVRTEYFVKNFRNSQAALDFINNRLYGISVMEGTRELFTGLGSSYRVESYSPLNLYYVQYKFPKIFDFEVELENEKK